MNQNVKVGFIILNYNTWQETAQLAEKVNSFSCIDKVIVVDNLSPNGSFDELKKIQTDDIIVVCSDKNGGYSYGNNIGAKVADGLGMDIVFVSNPDVDVEEEAIIKIVQAMVEHSEYAILSGVEYNIKGEVDLPVVWHAYSYWDDLLDCLVLTRKLQRGKKDIDLNQQPAEVVEVDLVKGSFFAVRMSDFRSVDFFDDNVFLFCEERILAKKMQDKGKKVGLLTNAIYFHNHSTSINQTYKKKSQQIALLYKARYYYNVKYNQIGLVKKWLLTLFMKLSIAEFHIIDYIRAKRHNR